MENVHIRNVKFQKTLNVLSAGLEKKPQNNRVNKIKQEHPALLKSDVAEKYIWSYLYLYIYLQYNIWYLWIF